ncbi:MAG: UDP-4-amino-4,6-dideoxy-N-acetyl-beta-L-altrosamine transaminase [Bacteriovoracaceae bacterium]|jgi:UDP-4-amino-4,6-dideoxy-N-acetyl-beta-L-altrosamine transaminase
MSLDVSKVEKELGRKVSGVSEMLKELHLDLNRGIHRKNNDLITSPNKVIPYGKHYIDKKDIEGVVNVLKDGFLTQGPLIEKFERKLADFVGAKYAVAMSSWTAGLHMAVMALGLKEGDGIVTSPNSFVASSNCGIYEGATPYFCDIDIKSGNMCPISLEKILIKNPHIKAIIPVHFGGFPCEMEKISAIAKKYDCKMIEDGAQALGGVYRNGKKIGDCQYSDMVGFSFHPVKNIACGEGGMLVTNDKELYLKLLRIRSHGIDKSHDLFENLDLAETDGEVNSWYYEMQSLGYNFRITDIQCSLGITQLDKLPGFMLKRIAIANRYDEAFEGLQNAYPIQIKQRELSGNHLYVLQVDFKKIGKSRNAVIKEMIQNGVFGHVHYIPIPMQPFYQKNYPMDVKSELPEVYKYYDGALTIPLFSSMTEDEITTVISVVKKVIG